MRNVRKASESCQILPPSKKIVKRLKPDRSAIGNALLKKLEPTLPLPRKTGKFKSPYKSPQILKIATKTNTNETQRPKLTNQISKNPVQNKSFNKARNEEVVSSKIRRSLPKMSPVKIQPIDPYKFCEPILKDCARSNGITLKDAVFKRSSKEQSRVNQEVLSLIKKTAEAIKVIRAQHEEWKKNH